jgi:AbrB family looped-hinge helix DNA binding protein
MTRVRVSSKGQLVLPKSARDALGLRPGDEVAVFLEAGAVRLLPLPRRKVAEVLDTLPGHAPNLLPGEDLFAAERASAGQRWGRDAG